MMGLNKKTQRSRSVQRVLKDQEVEASAPCRIDMGGTWDIKSLALPLQRVEPVLDLVWNGPNGYTEYFDLTEEK